MLGAIIGAIGGLLGQKASAKASAKAAAAANATQERIAERNIALQREFAKTGIQWKVADATKAGVHPLFALGASTHSFAPVSVGTSVPSTPDYGGAFANMGQGIGNAIESTMNGSDRMVRASQLLTLENQALQNEVLRTQISGSRMALSRGNPAMPVGDVRSIAGQGDAPLVNPKPAEAVPTAPGQPGLQPTLNPALQWFQHPDGGLGLAPSQEYKNATEDSPQETLDFGAMVWDQSAGNVTPPINPAPGKAWVYNPIKNRWYERSKSSLPSSMGGGVPNTYRRQPYGFR